MTPILKFLLQKRSVLFGVRATRQVKLFDQGRHGKNRKDVGAIFCKIRFPEPPYCQYFLGFSRYLECTLLLTGCRARSLAAGPTPPRWGLILRSPRSVLGSRLPVTSNKNFTGYSSLCLGKLACVPGRSRYRPANRSKVESAFGMRNGIN